jgi:hypothetical protein
MSDSIEVAVTLHCINLQYKTFTTIYEKIRRIGTVYESICKQLRTKPSNDCGAVRRCYPILKILKVSNESHNLKGSAKRDPVLFVEARGF